NRMMVKDLRFQAVFPIRLAEPPGVCELQPQEKVIVALKSCSMRSHQLFSQCGEIAQCLGANPKLVWVGASFVTNRNSLAPPYELRSALAEMVPAAQCHAGRPSIFGSVPALHRQNAPAISNGVTFPYQRPGKRR